MLMSMLSGSESQMAFEMSDPSRSPGKSPFLVLTIILLISPPGL